MKNTTLTALVAAISLSLFACKKNETYTEEQVAKMSPDEIGKALAEQLKTVATAVKDSDGDCDAMGTSVNKVVGNIKPLIDAEKKLDKAKQDELEEKYGKDAEKVFGEILPLLMKCKDNEKVQAAFEALG